MNLPLPNPQLFCSKLLVSVCLLLWLNGAPGWVRAQDKAEHPCAASRISTTPALLADGITSEAHRNLMQKYDLHWYKLDLQAEHNSLDLSGNVTLYATALAPSLTEFAFELHPNFTIEQVLLEGTPCVVRRSGSEVVALLPQAQPRQVRFKVQVFYAGWAPSGSSAAIGNGFNTAPTPWGGVTWSLSEPFAASEWFPCKQLLSDKADSVEVWVTTSKGNKVGSNGRLQRITPVGAQRHRYEWKSNYPIAYYLISVAIGPYEEYSFQTQIPGAPAPVLVQNYLYPGVLSSMKTDIDRTGDFLRLFSELYGVYPFHREKYGHTMAPIGGGMEHQTMTTQSNFEFSLTAHELAHQWWGDEVTCADWSHIWLNEGFASYSEYLAYERLLPANAPNWLNGAHQSALSAPQGSVFVRDSTNVARIFSSVLSYRKGALVLHMLRHALQNDALFFQALRAYREEYRYQVATTRDFQRVVERVSGRPLGYFFDQWVYGEGFPVFDVAWAQQKNEVYLQSRQFTSSPATPLFTTEVEYRIRMATKDTVVLVQHGQETENYRFKVSGQVTGVEVDPHQWLLNQATVRQDASIVPQAGWVAYPNPTQGAVLLKGGAGTPQQISIYDVVGRHVRTVLASGTSFSVEGLPAGTYLVRVLAAGEWSQVRVVKL
ncbi:M1 family aminopeptidase [Rufibacter psychrotolerans]|uniref:M1 family aminopeptidase n=1 Tax=Rufibacter psychrotolerans TaxID=2812556 RepID=UPI001968738E|nr:M1 family aminopeptidase [Rufibacter sp. SYSU D00308]